MRYYRGLDLNKIGKMTHAQLIMLYEDMADQLRRER